jgi:aspartate/methionine/tyrosine aminotransferase
MSVAFNEAVLNNNQYLKIDSEHIKKFIESICSENIEHDKRFVYYLLGATGICVVPLTSFFTSLPGFRMTLLEKDAEKFEKNIKALSNAIVQYVESSKY